MVVCELGGHLVQLGMAGARVLLLDRLFTATWLAAMCLGCVQEEQMLGMLSHSSRSPHGGVDVYQGQSELRA